jgi:hypothetical protein
VQVARLVAELLDDIHQYPDAFAKGGSPSKFLQYAVNTLFGGRVQRLASHLGIAYTELYNWCYDKKRPVSSAGTCSLLLRMRYVRCSTRKQSNVEKVISNHWCQSIGKKATSCGS